MVPLRQMMTDVMSRLRQNDPARGTWCVNGPTYAVWVDASSLAIGVAVEVNGAVIEDASWMRSEHDSQHINLAELDAVVRGINLALQ